MNTTIGSTPLSEKFSPPSRRIIAVDLARGLAIAGVVLFHVVWDLEFTGLISGVARHPLWLMFGRSLAGSFMVLVGISFVLAHRGRIRWPAFRRRLAIIIAAAAAITAITYIVFPHSFIYFGILHAIAAATVASLIFVRTSAALCLAAGIAIFALPFLTASPIFDTRWLAWIGFASRLPQSNDFVPIFPWVGLTLMGMSVAKWAITSRLDITMERYQPSGLVANMVANWGRKSLAIYLIHQPVLLALIIPLSWLIRAR